MHGDFSRWQFDGQTNDQGILQQQGRVLLDNDVNHQTFFSVRWQEMAGRDIIGRGVAGVPEERPDSFQVVAVRRDPDGASVTIRPGRIWANGHLVHLVHPPGEDEWVATRLGDVTDHGASGTRDAVVLELWLDAISGFQDERLLEPALGGPDTTERARLVTGLRLVRMTADEHCEAVAARLDGDPHGRLTVRLDPPTTRGDEDCPIDDPGGYRGPEHHLYRIEIADVNVGPERFKWSRFNGGLVGQGEFDAATDKLHLKANQRAIATSGLTSLYVEALAYDEDLRRWKVVYGGTGTLANDHEIDLVDHVYGVALPVGDRVFIRIWDGIDDVSAYPSAGAPLPDGNGIVVAFDEPGAPGDFWTFPVRAGLANPDTLLDAAAPQGIQRSFVPLAVLTWGTTDTVSIEDGAIADCRRRIPPLTRRDGCCTHTVGDGVHSHGEFRSIQDAIDALPPAGGRVCVLAGTHEGPVTISDREAVTLEGCGPRSRLVGPTGGTAAVLTIERSHGITIRSLAIEADAVPGIQIEAITAETAYAGASRPPDDVTPVGPNVTLRELAIEVRGHGAIVVNDGRAIEIVGNRILQGEVTAQELVEGLGVEPAIFVQARGARIEDNAIATVTPPLGARERAASFGGIQIGGGSSYVDIRRNRITGGSGNGITLGSLVLVEEATTSPRRKRIPAGNGFRLGDRCVRYRNVPSPGPTPGPGEPRLVPASEGRLQWIEIEHNEIVETGAAGVSVASFFDPAERWDVIEIRGLSLRHNTINRCLHSELEEIPVSARGVAAYGAIALGDVQFLQIEQNLVIDNGDSHVAPVCGVFVLGAASATIAANEVIGNGPQSRSAAEPAPGARGGIVVLASRPLDASGVKGSERLPSLDAARILDNVVVCPEGRALVLRAAGDVVVSRNRLVSEGMRRASIGAMTYGTEADPLAEAISDWDRLERAGGAAVLILGAGSGAPLELASVSVQNRFTNPVAPAPAPVPVVASHDPRPFVVTAPRLARREIGASPRTVPGRPRHQQLQQQQQQAPKQPAPQRVSRPGKVLFADNQVMLSPRRAGLRRISSALVVSGFDDVDVAGNQLVTATPVGAVFASARVSGATVRVRGNRFQEPARAVAYSAVIKGWLATATSNQSTHCLIVAGLPGGRIEEHNLVVSGLFNDKACSMADAIGEELWTARSNRISLDVERPVFVGELKEGPVGIPTSITSMTSFTTIFGDGKTATGPRADQPDMANAVRMFFENGGTSAYILNVGPITGTAAARQLAYATSLSTLASFPNIDAIAAPGQTEEAIQAPILEHVRTRTAIIAVLDGPIASNATGLPAVTAPHTVAVFPWLKSGDGTLSPPCGAVLGLAVTNDGRITMSAVRGAVGVDHELTDETQQILETRGYLCIRPIEGDALRVVTRLP